MDDIIAKSIRKNAAALKKLSLDIHSHPELGLEETKAAGWQTALLKKLGFKVGTPCCGLDTAYMATKGGGGPAATKRVRGDGSRIAFLAEYDALPEIGHACGHNLICAASIAAAEALAEKFKAEKIDATVLVFGTPGEEGKGGKIVMADKGAFDDVDLVLMAHPAARTCGWEGFLAIRRFNIEFFGKASHAAAAPEKGLNALDANLFLFSGVNAWRQHFLTTSRVHGIIQDGGTAPNIVPEYSSSSFYVRAATEKYLREMISKFKDIVRGAALMAGVKYELTEGPERYSAGLVLDSLNREYVAIARKTGMSRVAEGEDGAGSSDFGNVSQKVPGLHAYFCATDKDFPLHSKEFVSAAASEKALESMLKAAEAIARIGYRFATDSAFRAEVAAEFRKNKTKCG